MKLLFVIMATNQSANQIERLLDYTHRDSEQFGHLLIGYAADLHPEMKTRIGISAAIAFKSVIDFTFTPLKSDQPMQIGNDAFKQAAKKVSELTTWSFMWIEPDCTPVVTNWRQRISDDYENQPLPFMGRRMKVNKPNEKSPDIYFMNRVGCYPAGAVNMLNFDAKMLFEIASGPKVSPLLADYAGIQHLQINTNEDLAKIRDGVLMVRGDHHGILMIKQESQIKIPVTSEPEKESTPRIRKRNGNRS